MKKIVLLLVFAIIVPKLQAQVSPVIATMIDKVSADSLLQNTRYVCGLLPVTVYGRQDTILSRAFNQPGNELAFSYLKSRLQGYGIPVDSQQFGSRSKNLFGTLKGTVDSNKVIIIGAHYDNVGGDIAQGADDNASGVAAVLECARICARTPMAYTIIFAFWDEEELNALGSQAYATAFPATQRDILGSINLDMVAWDGNKDSTAEIHVRNVRNSALWAAKAVAINQDYNIGLRLNIINPGSSAMDATSFWNRNLPAIAINEDYTHDLNPHWHTVNDTIGNLSLPYFTMLTKLSLGTLLTYALPQSSGIGEVAHAHLTVWPNPADDLLMIERTTDLTGEAYANLYNLEGKKAGGWILTAHHKTTRIDLQKLVPGLYRLIVRDAQGMLIYNGPIVKR